ncbi:MAG: hypothetical protein OEV66_02070 [Spirochaetia bacterium]|nr:hypothetical protein [Spirochaetia bacterium]
MIKTLFNIFLVLASSMALSQCSATAASNCQSTPSATGLTTSSATSISHRPGEACLGCHGGSVSTVFTSAGTLYVGANSTTTATTGTVTVDTQSLTVDTCGNFYTTKNIAFPASTSTAAKAMSNPASSGDCNASGCHDSNRRVY